MPKFGRVSLEKLATCHPDIQRVMNEVIKIYDITVLEGARDISTQRDYIARGVSKTLNSKHLVQSDGYSHAIDVMPYPVDWGDKPSHFFMAGLIMGVAKQLGVNLRWGHDWDGDMNFYNQSFMDTPHFELRS